MVQTVGDNCSYFIQLSKAIFNCQNSSVGYDSVLVTATDRSGNSNQCYAVVNIVSSFSGGIAYVKADATGQNSGTSWIDAFPTLHDALTAQRLCGGITEIWVASGIYKPAAVYNPDNSGPYDPRERTFYLDQNIKLYGGFSGTETAVNQRNISANPTILSGDLDIPGDNSDNAYHIIYMNGRTSPGQITDAMVIDGFIFRDGNGNGSLPFQNGGAALYLEGSWGGGCSPQISNCQFFANRASFGAVMYNDAFNGGTSSPQLFNCLFYDNLATGRGGVMYNAGGTHGNSNPLIFHCTFSNNTAAGGSVMFNDSRDSGNSQPAIISSILWQNGNSPVLHLDGTGTLLKCSIYDDGSPNNSVSLPAGVSGFGNKDLDPQFVSVAGGNFRLKNGSPAIDAGDTLFAYPVLLKDLGGNPRPQGLAVDLGAYEGAAGFSCPYSAVIYVDASATGANDGTSWYHAFRDLQDALDAACPGSEVWVAQGTYKPRRAYDALRNGGIDLRERTFYIHKNIKLYGGFAAGDSVRADQNPTTRPTILSGDLGIPGNSVDNAYHVVYFDARTSAGNITQVMEMDGFIIRDGKAEGANPLTGGGGGMYLEGSWGTRCQPTISRCFFTKNEAVFGGAMYKDAFNGGNSSFQMLSCVFYHNAASGAASVMYNAGGTNGQSNPNMLNCTFLENDMGVGGIMLNDGRDNGTAQPTLTNGILWQNGPNPILQDNASGTVLNYCIYDDGIIDGNVILPAGVSGSNNLDANPAFVDQANGNMRLTACSPGLNAGFTALVGGQTLLPDIAGVARPQGGVLEIGAYEYVGTPSTFPKLAQQNCGSCGEIRFNYCRYDTLVPLEYLIRSGNSAYDPGNSFRWYADNNGAPGALLGGEPPVNTNNTGTQYYWVSQTQGLCPGSPPIRVRVRVKKIFYPTLTLPPPGCPGAQINLANVPGDPKKKATAFTFYSQHPTVFPNQTPIGSVTAVNGVVTPGQTVLTTLSANYPVIYVKSTVPNGCGGVVGDTLSFSNSPTVDFIPVDTAIHGSTVTIGISTQNTTLLMIQDTFGNTSVATKLGPNSYSFSRPVTNTTSNIITLQFRAVPYNGNCAGTARPFYIAVVPSGNPRFAGLIEASEALEVFPNPTSGRLTLRQQRMDLSLQWQLTDMLGKIVMQGEMNEAEMVIDVSALSAGLYHLMTMSEEGGRTLHKIVKQ